MNGRGGTEGARRRSRIRTTDTHADREEKDGHTRSLSLTHSQTNERTQTHTPSDARRKVPEPRAQPLVQNSF